jgi:hypothetical protein
MLLLKLGIYLQNSNLAAAVISYFYKRPGDINNYNRPDGTSTYKRP